MSWFIGHQAAYNIENVTWFAWRDLAGKPICQWCANAGLFKAALADAEAGLEDADGLHGRKLTGR